MCYKISNFLEFINLDTFICQDSILTILHLNLPYQFDNTLSDGLVVLAYTPNQSQTVNWASTMRHNYLELSIKVLV